MSLSFDIETLVQYFVHAAYAARYELIAALVFVVGVHLGKLASRRKKPQLQKVLKQPKRMSSGRSRPNQVFEKPGLDMTQFDASLRGVDSALLKDFSWLVPQVVKLCRTQVKQALQMYRAAKQAGLNMQEAPAEQSVSLFGTLVPAIMRSGQSDEAVKLFEDISACGVEVSAGIFASAVKLCTSKQHYAQVLAIFDMMIKDPTFVVEDKSIWSCVLFCSTETKDYQRASVVFEHLKECGTPSSKDFGNMIRLAALNSDWNKALSIIKDMRASGVEIDSVQYNTVLATCVAIGKVQEACTLLESMEVVGGVADVITYNTLMKGYAKSGQIDECFGIFDRLQEKGLTPSQVTYGILLDCCINENQVARAMKVFEQMTTGGCALNTVLYTMLIKGFTRAGDCDQAMSVYKHMQQERDILPDLITFSILIKANCDSDRPKEALQLLDDMLALGLKPDEVVFNNLLAGCARQSNAKLGKQLYEDMIASGVRPSNATFSILIRLQYQCKQLEDAVTLLRTEPAKHNVVPEPRLFLQLMQSCVRERQGKRAVEVYEMLCESSSPTAAMHSSMLNTCMKLNMYDTAAEILQIAAAKGARVDRRDTNIVIDGALRKNKPQLLQSLVASTKALGHPVDAKYVMS